MEFPKDKKIVLFDGVCNLCNNKVNFLIQHDKNDVFRLAAIQSETGQQIIKYLGLPKTLDSIILYEPGFAYYTKSEAVFKILNELSTNLKFLFLFSYLPNSFNDFFYDLIAKNRYNWYGKKENCMLPTSDTAKKFL